MNNFFTTVGLILTFVVSSFSISEPSVPSDGSTQKIKINVSYAAESLWTEAEIRERFKIIKDDYKKACPGVDLVLNELIRVEDKSLQDIDGSLTSQGVNQINKILALFKRKAYPTILYVRQGKWDFDIQIDQNQFADSIGKAYMFGGPRALPNFQNLQWNDLRIREQSATGWEMGNLDWKRFKELRPLHGLILIGQASSIKSINNSSNKDLTNLERHELGHVLLNDGSHRDTPTNYMSNNDVNRYTLDSDQCELIRSYNQMERLRDDAIQKGMAQVCALYEQKGLLDRPSYCITRK